MYGGVPRLAEQAILGYNHFH